MLRRCSWLALAAALVAGPALAHDASRHVQSQRQTFNFNPDWKMKHGEMAGAQAAMFDDSGWEAVTLPNAFNDK